MTLTTTRPDYAVARKAMIDSQLRTSGVNEAFVLERMSAVPREEFVPEGARHRIYGSRDPARDRRLSARPRCFMARCWPKRIRPRTIVSSSSMPGAGTCLHWSNRWSARSIPWLPKRPPMAASAAITRWCWSTGRLNTCPPRWPSWSARAAGSSPAWSIAASRGWPPAASRARLSPCSRSPKWVSRGGAFDRPQNWSF